MPYIRHYRELLEKLYNQYNTKPFTFYDACQFVKEYNKRYHMRLKAGDLIVKEESDPQCKTQYWKLSGKVIRYFQNVKC